MPRTPDQIPDATLRLVLAPGIGVATLRALRRHFGDDGNIVECSVTRLSEIDGIARKSAEVLRRAIDGADPDAERQRMVEHDVSMIALGDADYPPLLAAIPDPPVALWLRGTMIETDSLAIGIVGSRRCTSYGREQAGRLAATLAQCGYTIVSGGALGIDGEAHRGAIRGGGRTIAVMGCGLARCYPPEHLELFEQIAGGAGALVSEFPMAAEPKPEHFPRRNRVISGLSVGVIVVEASHRSGSLITARLAGEQHGREVMAVPGRVDSPASAGCLAAIREGWAALVTSAADVLDQLDSAGQLMRGAMEAAGSVAATTKPGEPDSHVSERQELILRALDDAGAVVGLDELARRCGLPMSELLAEVTMLEVRGRLKRDHRGVERRR